MLLMKRLVLAAAKAFKKLFAVDGLHPAALFEERLESVHEVIVIPAR